MAREKITEVEKSREFVLSAAHDRDVNLMRLWFTDTLGTLKSVAMNFSSLHHEGAPSQHEIDLRYTDALTMADNLMTFRLVVKEVASESGYYATFMPKPCANHNGSGMHLNMSLFEGARSLFHDENDADKLSGTARHFIAGLLKHARELTLSTNQWVNSYKRLVPHFEAPTRVTWAKRNHADLVRAPSVKPEHENSEILLDGSNEAIQVGAGSTLVRLFWAKHSSISSSPIKDWNGLSCAGS